MNTEEGHKRFRYIQCIFSLFHNSIRRISRSNCKQTLLEWSKFETVSNADLCLYLVLFRSRLPLVRLLVLWIVWNRGALSMRHRIELDRFEIAKCYATRASLVLLRLLTPQNFRVSIFVTVKLYLKLILFISKNISLW